MKGSILISGGRVGKRERERWMGKEGGGKSNGEKGIEGKIDRSRNGKIKTDFSYPL